MVCKYFNKNVVCVRKLVDYLYNDLGERSGGLLHIVLDDGNLEDEHIKYCLNYIEEPENTDRKDKQICLEIAKTLLKMSMYERNLVYYDEALCQGNCQKCVITDTLDDIENDDDFEIAKILKRGRK